MTTKYTYIGQINVTKKKRGESIPGSRRSRDQLKVLKVKIVDSKRLEGMGIGGNREGNEQMKVSNETGCSRGGI
jgi:hypothetical protein